MRFVFVAAGLAAAASVAGCAASPSPAPVAVAAASPARPPMSASGGLDGVYRGPAGGTSGNSRCNRTLGSAIRVAGGVASMTTAVTGTLEGPVGPDGSVLIQSGRASLSGQFTSNAFNGTYSNNGCAYTLAYTKS